MKYSAILIASLILCACATTPVTYELSKEVPLDRRSEAYDKFVSKDRAAANVIIIRDSGITGSAGSVPIFVNGERVCYLYTSESMPMFLEPGEHLLGISLIALSEKGERNNLREQVLEVIEGEVYFYRVGILEGEGLVMQRSSQLN